MSHVPRAMDHGPGTIRSVTIYSTAARQLSFVGSRKRQPYSVEASILITDGTEHGFQYMVHSRYHTRTKESHEPHSMGT
jgi:hypothetical protein